MRASFAEAAAIEGGSLSAWLAFGARWWTEDVEMIEDASFPGAGTFNGRQAVAERFAEYTETLPGAFFDIEDIESDGDVHVLHLLLKARGGRSGVPLNQRWLWVIHMTGDGISGLYAFLDLDEARAAAARITQS